MFRFGLIHLLTQKTEKRKPFRSLIKHYVSANGRSPQSGNTNRERTVNLSIRNRINETPLRKKRSENNRDSRRCQQQRKLRDQLKLLCCMSMSRITRRSGKKVRMDVYLVVYRMDVVKKRNIAPVRYKQHQEQQGLYISSVFSHANRLSEGQI